MLICYESHKTRLGFLVELAHSSSLPVKATDADVPVASFKAPSHGDTTNDDVNLPLEIINGNELSPYLDTPATDRHDDRGRGAEDEDPVDNQGPSTHPTGADSC